MTHNNPNQTLQLQIHILWHLSLNPQNGGPNWLWWGRPPLPHTPLPDFQVCCKGHLLDWIWLLLPALELNVVKNNNSVLLQGLFALHYIIIWSKIWLLLLVLWSCRAFAQGIMLTLSMLRTFSCFIVICWLLILKINFFKKLFQEYYPCQTDSPHLKRKS